MSDEQHVNWFALEKALRTARLSRMHYRFRPLGAVYRQHAVRTCVRSRVSLEIPRRRRFLLVSRAKPRHLPRRSRRCHSWRGYSFLTRLPELSKGKAKKYKAQCPACAGNGTAWKTNSLSFIAGTEDPRFSALFTASEGLCVPHYRMLLSHIKNAFRLGLRNFSFRNSKPFLSARKTLSNIPRGEGRPILRAFPIGTRSYGRELALALRGSAEIR